MKTWYRTVENKNFHLPYTDWQNIEGYLQEGKIEKKSQFTHSFLKKSEMWEEKDYLLQNQMLKISCSDFILQFDVVTLSYITQKMKIRHPIRNLYFESLQQIWPKFWSCIKDLIRLAAWLFGICKRAKNIRHPFWRTVKCERKKTFYCKIKFKHFLILTSIFDLL